jgi:uncharacterized damage-inducible protein DinB
MTARESLLPEFDHETSMTRLVLARVPEAAFGWRPHPKSFDMAGLASHLAQLPRWGTSILTRDFYDLATSGPRTPSLPNVAEILATFDRHVREVRAALVEMTEGQLLQPWALRRGDKLVLSVPKISAIRGFVIRHMVHHRGQLTVYLRMNDVPLPPLYGTTADETL